MKSKGLLLVNFASGMSVADQETLTARFGYVYGKEWNIIMAQSDTGNTSAEFILCGGDENGLNGKRKYNRKKAAANEG